MSDTTTPKRNEAVAYRVHVPDEPDLGHWYEDVGETEPEFVTTETHDALYSQEQMDALQGEVSRLREALDRLVLAADSAAHSCNTAMMDQAIDMARNALNLEPPTDGR